MAQVKDHNNFTPAAITKYNGSLDSGVTKWNGITYDPTYSGSPYNDIMTYSCMFDEASGTFLDRTISADSDNLMSLSVWIKLTGALGTDNRVIFNSGEHVGSDGQFFLKLNSGDNIDLVLNGSGTARLITNTKLRDCSGWYHIVVGIDTTQAVAADRVNIYVNGTQITSFSTENYPALNYDLRQDDASATQYVAEYASEDNRHLDANFAHLEWIDGTQCSASDFGETVDGIWVPKAYTGAYGSEGVLLDFATNTHFGDDTSGNGNDFTDNNFGTDHQLLDIPENNCCTLDFNNKYTAPTAFTESGLYMNHTPAGYASACGTFLFPTSGKWYWEIDISSSDIATPLAGIVKAGERSGDLITSSYYIGQDTDGVAIQSNGTAWYLTYNAGFTIDDNLPAPANNDIIQVAVDCDAGYIWFGVNNTWGDFGATGVGDPAGGSNPAHSGLDFTADDYVPAITCYTTDLGPLNFGQRTFAHTPPTGFKALCSENMADPTVNDPQDEYINVVTYTGNGTAIGSGGNAITGVGFQPDFVWIKNRDQADGHLLYDSVRGATKDIRSNVTNAEATDTEGLSTFDADGFTVGSKNGVNTNTEDYVALCLQKQTNFFDIQTYEGTGAAHTESHSLGVAPEMIIVKNLDDTDSWAVYHSEGLSKTDPETDHGHLDTNVAWADDATLWNDTAPTSSVFTVGTGAEVDTLNETYIAYLFASVDGISKVFSYEGNGNAAGPYVYCGFRPQWILLKNADAIDSWILIDTKRDIYNPLQTYLLADANSAEATATIADAASNGFKIRNTGSSYNNNNNTIVGIAFADQPFKYANAR